MSKVLVFVASFPLPSNNKFIQVGHVTVGHRFAIIANVTLPLNINVMCFWSSVLDKDVSQTSKYLKLLFNISLGMLFAVFLFVLFDWYFFDEQHKEFIKPFGLIGLVGFGLGVVLTLLFRKRL